MKAIILAAGYGVRLQRELEILRQENPGRYEKISPSLEARAKPMVLVAGKPIVQHIVENIEGTDVDEIFIVTNNKYFRQFEEWKDSYDNKIPIKLLNDGTDANEERLGAVNDFKMVLDEEDVDDDVLLIAGDNLLKFDLKELIDCFKNKKTSIIAAYREKNPEKIRKSACVEIDDNGQVIDFEEKPPDPGSEWICPAIYIYDRDTINLIKEMKFEEDKKDLIGNIPAVLYSRISIHAFRKEDKIRFDLGSIADFEKAEEHFSGKGRIE